MPYETGEAVLNLRLKGLSEELEGIRRELREINQALEKLNRILLLYVLKDKMTGDKPEMEIDSLLSESEKEMAEKMSELKKVGVDD